jgi:hypothetical protein
MRELVTEFSTSIQAEF